MDHAENTLFESDPVKKSKKAFVYEAAGCVTSRNLRRILQDADEAFKRSLDYNEQVNAGLKSISVRIVVRFD